MTDSLVTQIWTKKYEPKDSEEIQGQNKAISELKTFLLNFKKSPKKSALLYGPPGSGKTCSVYAIARETGFEVLEINASDFRNKDAVSSIIGVASKQMSLFFKGKIILVDEVDGLSGTKDRGGLSELLKIIEESRWPIIMTMANPWDQKFSDLRKKTTMIEFHTLNYLSVFAALKRICESEKIGFDETSLKALARRAGGDLRAAINDLYSLTQESRNLSLTELSELSERKSTESITSALMKIFKTSQAEIALSALDNVDEDIDKIFLWLEENIPKEYTKPEDLCRAFDCLSKADVYSRRIRRWQYWRFLVYINSHLSAGIATAKDEKYKSFVSYSPSSRILKIWQSNMKFQKRDAIAQKVATKTHSSLRRTKQDTMPFLKTIFENDKKLAADLASEFELDEKEIEWLIQKY